MPQPEAMAGTAAAAGPKVAWVWGNSPHLAQGAALLFPELPGLSQGCRQAGTSPTSTATDRSAARRAARSSALPVVRPQRSPPTKSALGVTMPPAGQPDHSDGSMLALYPPPEVARGLAIPGGLDLESLHLTVAYTGHAADVGRKTLRRAAQNVAAVTAPITGTVSGHAASPEATRTSSSRSSTRPLWSSSARTR